MKKLPFLLIAFLFLLSCKKDDKEYIVTGVVVDSFTQRPVSGIHVGYFTLGDPIFTLNEPYVSYPVNYQQRTVTDQSGRFEFALPDDPDHKYYLASENLYERYRSRALIGGQQLEFQIAPYTTVSEPDKNFLRLTQNTEVSIQIDPKPLCRFEYPAIPDGWASYWCYISLEQTTNYFFYNTVEGLVWLKQQVFAVNSDDQHIRGSFKVQANIGSYVEDVAFDVYCPVGDTTVVWLGW